jgi:hypothetical protein
MLGPVMFQESAAVDRPSDEIARLLSERPPAWLRPLAAWAWDEAGATAEIEVGPGDLLLHRKVRVDVGAAQRRPDGSTAVPLRWRAARHPHLFPTLDGHLVVSDAGGDSARITFVARYDPPLGALGRSLDDALLHGLAHDTVVAFLTRVVDALDGTRAGAGR